jgi:Predicted pyridoxal phosphate-dependent enzyme apparently involved in regulation of cell wall biogenesis
MASLHPQRHEAIHVTKAIVPDPAEYAAYIMRLLDSRQLTNMGEHAILLEQKLRAFLNVPYLALCTNGTLALQLAIRAAHLAGKEVITTPFSYVATLSALLWEGCTPVFVDIDEETLCLDSAKVENVISDATAAILPVHVYGAPCDIESIAALAGKYGLTTIYDAAQAFGTLYNGHSLLQYGDFSTASFHATKVFHTVEGGGIISNTPEADRQIRLLRAFGHIGDTHYTLGINAKITEPHAAMGLCLLDKVSENIAGREKISQAYDALLPMHGVRKPARRPGTTYNYAYYPIVFESAGTMHRALTCMNEENIFPRRYFYPALNTLPYLSTRTDCPLAESISTRTLCLPLYAELDEHVVERIMHIIGKSL